MSICFGTASNSELPYSLFGLVKHNTHHSKRKSTPQWDVKLTTSFARSSTRTCSKERKILFTSEQRDGYIAVRTTRFFLGRRSFPWCPVTPRAGRFSEALSGIHCRVLSKSRRSDDNTWTSNETWRRTVCLLRYRTHVTRE